MRQRIPAAQRRALRRQALQAGVPWTKADEYEPVTDGTLAEAAESAGELWGSGATRSVDEEINERRKR